MTVEIRPLAAADDVAWRALWRDYLAFYETSVAEDVYATTFARLTDPGVPEMGAFVAVADRPVGLVHYIFHRHCWRPEGICYLQDLFVDPGSRGTGAGRALIEAVYREADRQGVPAVYWMTQDFNTTARQLYDRIAVLTPFIKYQRR
ncbi:MAG: GNAT family N-acetyltransferase [Paracoccaceae bacterium]